MDHISALILRGQETLLNRNIHKVLNIEAVPRDLAIVAIFTALEKLGMQEHVVRNYEGELSPR